MAKSFNPLFCLLAGMRNKTKPISMQIEIKIKAKIQPGESIPVSINALAEQLEKEFTQQFNCQIVASSVAQNASPEGYTACIEYEGLRYIRLMPRNIQNAIANSKNTK